MTSSSPDHEARSLLDPSARRRLHADDRLPRPGRRPPRRCRCWSGGSPRSGAGSSAANTWGKRSSPMICRSALNVSGASGKAAVDGAGRPWSCEPVPRAIPAPRPSSGAAATPPRARRPRRPWPRASRSAVRAGPSGMATFARLPRTSPTDWPTMPPAIRMPTAAKNSWTSPASENASRMRGSARAARARPRASPAQEMARARKPRRWPATMAETAATAMKRSRKVTGRPVTEPGSEIRCGRPCGGRVGPLGPRCARSGAAPPPSGGAGSPRCRAADATLPPG